jgi:hypothetical protein
VEQFYAIGWAATPTRPVASSGVKGHIPPGREAFMSYFRSVDAFAGQLETIDQVLERLEQPDLSYEELRLCLAALDASPEGHSIASEIRAELPGGWQFREAWPAKWKGPGQKSDSTKIPPSLRIAGALARIRTR